MRKLHVYIGLFLLLVMCCIAISWNTVTANKLSSQKNAKIKIQAPEDQEVRSDGISISVLNSGLAELENFQLIISGTYGTTILKLEKSNEKWFFQLPATVAKRAGVVQWNLVLDQNSIQKGQFQLLPSAENLGALENYLGPRSIVANVRDYTMLVAIPTDSLDNMLPDGTQVSLNHQFKNQITRTPFQLDKGFAWQRIQAPLTTGRISTGSTLNDISSLELVADVFPDVAVDFQLELDQNHSYADGNEISTFKTSQIKDEHGNVMTDGTLVKFFMSDATGSQWQTVASTINGYAFAKAIHPQTPTKWNVKALIQGIAESPDLQVTFNSIIDDIPVELRNKKTIVVGPLTSHLGQIIPDGIQVRIELTGKTHILFTEKGIATFVLDDAVDGNENITITTLGLTKNSKIGSLEKE
ncbi:hypothetical protein SAMN05192588_0624 [Nonlabens sp. Hel1_33_55]|uniref:hypothetical protein n=1 Tax=Nonlabens sp. Hel1_33_55 TaxID=1336802 RepID=UPI000875AC8B|nr:hypothetical protein [Nonlabens sp. Hel1_33_55]SCX99352.1 hypothetical protein SAMN05192588_0624 [Nonlabens sp. Hel1_33_55]